MADSVVTISSAITAIDYLSALKAQLFYASNDLGQPHSVLYLPLTFEAPIELADSLSLVDCCTSVRCNTSVRRPNQNKHRLTFSSSALYLQFNPFVQAHVSAIN